MNEETQNLLDAAFRHAVKSYLHACEMAERLSQEDTVENRRIDRLAGERNSGVLELLGVLLDRSGYDVRMSAPNPGGDPTSFIQWTKVERLLIEWGYAKGLIERDHMLAWFDHNQTNGWLRDDKRKIPA